VLKLKSKIQEDCSKGYNNDGPDVSLGGSLAKLIGAIVLVSSLKYEVGPFVGYQI
jgi:hypothetical protein